MKPSFVLSVAGVGACVIVVGYGSVAGAAAADHGEVAAVEQLRPGEGDLVPREAGTASSDAARDRLVARERVHRFVRLATDVPALQGKWGIGAEMATPASGICVRRWFSEGLAMEMAVGGSGMEIRTATDVENGDSLEPRWDYTVGLGTKFNVGRPVRGLLLQGIARASFSQMRNKQVYNIQTSDRKQMSGDLFLGTGFEFFVPFLNALSIECRAGISGGYTRSVQTVSARYPTGLPRLPQPTHQVVSGWSVGVSRANSSLSGLLKGNLTYYF